MVVLFKQLLCLFSSLTHAHDSEKKEEVAPETPFPFHLSLKKHIRRFLFLEGNKAIQICITQHQIKTLHHNLLTARAGEYSTLELRSSRS